MPSAFLSAVLILSATTPLSVRLGKEGDILGWLVAGPFPNEGALQRRGTGFRTDYLGGEPAVNPSEGDPAGAHHWRFATGSREHGIDLKGLFRWNDPGIAYCFANIESPREQSARLLFGSDDGAKLYLNGVQLYSKQIARGIKRDEESVDLQLHAGRNRLLFKIEQGDGDWGLMARIVGGSGLFESLPILDEAEDRFARVRPQAYKDGSLDLEAWERFHAIRDAAKRFLIRFRTQAAEPEHLASLIQTGTDAVDRPTQDLDHLSADLNQFSSAIEAAYRISRAPMVRWAQDPGPLVMKDSMDWIQVMKGGRYFAFPDGRPFIPLGANHNPDWAELDESNPLSDRFDPARTDRWFATLAANGVNVVRLMVETPPSGNLEEADGAFRPEHLVWLDHIVQAAQAHGVRLWVTPYDTFWMNLKKETSTYWAENGGPIHQPIDFLTKQEVIDREKRRLHFLIDRFGNSGVIFAWEVMNEIDLWWGASAEQIKAWMDQVVPDIRRYEKAKWGRNHLVTVSFAKAEPAGLDAETAFRRPDLDFATMHLYLGASRGPQPGQAEQAAHDFAEGVLYARREVTDRRPVLDGESGPIDHWIVDEKFDDEVFHDMSWAHLMAGGAGSGTRWPYRSPHHITAGMLATLHAMSQFCAEAPWHSLTDHAKISSSPVDSAVRASSLATDSAAIAWIRGRVGEAVDLDKPAGAHRYRCFDIRAGRWFGQARAISGRLHIVLPAGIPELAVWIAP